jgi:hypothetical protein
MSNERDERDEDLPSPREGDGLDESELDETSDAGLDDVDMRELLRGALRPPPGAVAPQLLTGVQRRLRLRSRGKFYGDGWSTAHEPRSTYLVTSLVMLALVVLVLLVLVPWSTATLP